MCVGTEWYKKMQSLFRNESRICNSKKNMLLILLNTWRLEESWKKEKKKSDLEQTIWAGITLVFWEHLYHSYCFPCCFLYLYHELNHELYGNELGYESYDQWNYKRYCHRTSIRTSPSSMGTLCLWHNENNEWKCVDSSTDTQRELSSRTQKIANNLISILAHKIYFWLKSTYLKAPLVYQTQVPTGQGRVTSQR